MDAMSSGDPVKFIQGKYPTYVTGEDLHDTFCRIWHSMNGVNVPIIDGRRRGPSLETLTELHALTKQCYQSATATQRMVLGDLNETIKKCEAGHEYFWYE